MPKKNNFLVVGGADRSRVEGVAGSTCRGTWCVARNGERRSVYDLAWQTRNMTIASELAKAGPGFTTETDPNTGYTFLQRAVQAQDEQSLQFLLELGAGVVR